MSSSLPPNDFFLFSSALMCVLDAKGIIMQLNPAWEKKFNVVRTDIKYSHYLAWVHPEDKANSRDKLAQLVNGKSSVTFSNRWRDCSGYYHWLNWDISAVRGENEEEKGESKLIFYAVASDITTQKHTEKVLCDTEERFELAIRGSNLGLWDWNLETNEIYLSPRWKNMLGYQDDEIANHLDEWCRFVHPDDFMEMWATIEAYLDKRMPQYESAYRVCHKDGTYRWVVARAAALWDANDQPHRMVGTYVDITERKQIEQALEENEALLSAIFEVTKIGLCVTSQQGQVVRVNSAYCELYGYSAEELRGQPFTLLLSPEYHEEAFKLHQALLDGHSTVESEGEWRIQDKLGNYREVSFTMGLLSQNHGQCFRVTAITDITKRKHLELERNRMFNLSLDMQSIIGFDVSFKEINAAWERTLGWSKTELLEKSSLDLVHPDDNQASTEIIQQLMGGQTIFGFENRYLCKNGTYKWLSWNVYPLVDQQTMYAVTRDITERKRAEEEIRRQQAFIRLVVDSVPNLIFIKDHLGRFIFVNQAVANLLSCSIEKLVYHKNPKFHYPPEFISTLYSKTEEEVIEYLHEIAVEETYCNAQGEARCFHIVKKPFMQSVDDVLVLSVGTDITERKQHEVALKQNEVQLKETVAELETILDNSVVGIAYVKNGIFIRVNHKLESLLGYAKNEWCNLPLQRIYSSPQEYQEMEQKAYPLLSHGKEYDAQHLICTKTDNVFWSRIVVKAVDAHELNKGAIWMIEDITVQKQAEQHLRLTATVFETSVNGIIVTDINNIIRRVNPALTKITGYTEKEVCGKSTSFLSSGQHNKQFYKAMWESINGTGHWQGEIWNRKKNGELYVAWLSISAIINEQKEPVQYMAVLTDISSLQEDIERVRYLANYDSLTRLPNRLLFHDNLLQIKKGAARHKKQFALLFIDLDGFKPVNDNLGHAIGDQLLQGVAKRLQNCVHETDMVARLGGDEFTVILSNVKKVQEVANMATNIVQCLQKPFQLNENRVIISASIGISMYPYDTNEIDTLIKYADHAMYQAKNAGKGRYCFYKS